MAGLDLTTQFKAIQDLVVASSGIPDERVMWVHGNFPVIDYPRITMLPLLVVDQHHRPHVKYNYNGGNDNLDPTFGQHQLLQVSINSWGTSNAPTEHARYLAELTRIGLRKPSSLATLLAAELGFSRVSEIRDLSELISAKQRTRAQFDLFLNVTRNFADTAIEYISTIEYELDLTNVGAGPEDSGVLTLP